MRNVPSTRAKTDMSIINYFFCLTIQNGRNKKWEKLHKTSRLKQPQEFHLRDKFFPFFFFFKTKTYFPKTTMICT